MVKYIFRMSLGFVGTDREEVAEYDDDVDEDTVSKDWNEWIRDQIDGSYVKMEE